MPFVDGLIRLAGEAGEFVSTGEGRSLGDIVTESERDARSRFLSTSADGGSSECLVETPCPIRPLRPVELLASPLVRDINAGTAVRGVPGDVGGRDSGTELIEWAPRL